MRVSVASETRTHVIVRCDIEDTGIGISPAAQAGLFQPFSQADGSTTRKYGGTGLGLAISKRLVLRMDGQIGVQSQPGTGSKFWFTAKLEKQGTPPVAKETCSVRDPHVLVVDDNATNRQILRHQLRACNVQPHCAASGEEALKMMRQAAGMGKPYGLTLLDFHMPGMDGLTLGRAIKSDPDINASRLTLLTSLGLVLSPSELHEAGIDSCLIKPVKQTRLFDCLTQAIGRMPAETTGLITHTPTTARIPLTVSQPLAKRRILLAEDNLVNQKVALGQLKKLGFRVDAVTDGLEALKALEKGSYDVILMDCQMPGLDGYQATHTIRERERTLDGTCPWKVPIHIVAMTAHAMQGEREKCLAAGMDDYIAKPVMEAALKAVLEKKFKREE